MTSSKDFSSRFVSSATGSPCSIDSSCLIASSSSIDSPCSAESSTFDDDDTHSRCNSSVTCDSSIAVCSSLGTALDSEKIQRLLSTEKRKYQIVKDESPSDASWWKAFGFPARLDENNTLQRIPGFISCFKCMNTQVYKHSSGTKRFKEHAEKCFPSSTSTISSSVDCTTSSSTQATLDQMGFKKSVKINEKDALKIKDLSAEWICGDIRPFSVLDDPGLRNLAQECVRLGHAYGFVNINDILRGQRTMSRHIVSMADNLRIKVKEILSIPLKERSLTISPDYWCDRHKQVSYLGATATFVDGEFGYKSIDLFCRPFSGKTKSAELTLKELYKNLESFGISTLSGVNIMCDRGSNFRKGFEDLEPLFCFGHRLNNVLKRAFFQNQMKKKKKSVIDHNLDAAIAAATSTLAQTSPSVDLKEEISTDESDLSSEDDCGSNPAIPVVRKKAKSIKTTSKPTRTGVDLLSTHQKMTVDQIPASAKQVLRTLNQCKKIVKHAKKSGMNKEIEDLDGGALHQFSVVRWLSMTDLMESILKSFKIIKRLLISKKQHSLTTDFHEQTIKQLVLILKPFKHIMTIIQRGNSPSLYMVLMCTITLRDAFSSFEALLNYNVVHCGYKQGRDAHDFDEDQEFESEGIRWLRERILALFNEMVTLDVRHYCATLLHPKYRSLKNCTENERLQCYKYIREQLNIIRCETTDQSAQQLTEPQPKKFKKNDDLFSQFEDDRPLNIGPSQGGGSGSESDEYDFDIKQSDELDRYLIMEIDKSTISNDPLNFWKSQSEQFPLLSKFAKRIHSIPATSASVERQFSAAGLVINDRRTNLSPHQLDNILLIRSAQKLN